MNREDRIALYAEMAALTDKCAPGLPTTDAALARRAEIVAALETEHVTEPPTRTTTLSQRRLAFDPDDSYRSSWLGLRAVFTGYDGTREVGTITGFTRDGAFPVVTFPCGAWARLDLRVEIVLEAPSCNCEHGDHFTRSAFIGCHDTAGEARALYVGAICDRCAREHLADYLVPADAPQCNGCGEILVRATGCRATDVRCLGCGGDYPRRHVTATCGHCDRSWCEGCDSTPAARCLFEGEHAYGEYAPDGEPGRTLADVMEPLREYVVTMSHDHGTIRIRTSARSADAAREIVCRAEGAPLSAAVACTRVADDTGAVSPSFVTAVVIVGLFAAAVAYLSGWISL